MSASSKAKAFGVGAAVVWGVWQIAQSEAVTPGGTSTRTGNLVKFADDQQDGVIKATKDVRENTGELTGEVVSMLDADGVPSPPEEAGE